MANFVGMRLEFVYSDDFMQMNSPTKSHCCMHLLCTEGEGSFVYNGRCYHIVKNDLVVLIHPERAKNLSPHPEMKSEMFAGNYQFMQSQLPSNNYSIGGSISLNSNPVIPLTDDEAQRILRDIHRLKDRMNERQLRFYKEMMGSLCLVLMYDIFEAHARRDASDTQSDRTGHIVKSLISLLSTGISKTERDVRYYARSLNVSPKYLSATIRRLTGHSVTFYIDRFTVPILKELLNDTDLSLTQISERMNFTSLSYFSRYCTKHLGQAPRTYRKSLQPKAIKET